MVERIELAPLDDADVGALVRRLAGEVPARTVDDVVARAEGNAFYAEELLAAGLQGEALPLALTDVLLARVEQRSPAVQQVLRIAAVAGRRVRHELVAAVGGLATGELDQALAEAVHHHLLVVSDDGRYRFRHALLREAVLADLLPGERVRLHAAVAGYLRGTPGAGTAAERAHHARESNDLPAAFEASLEAAVDACRVGAPAEQLQHLEAALALWTAVPDAEQRAGRDLAALLFETAATARTVGELHRAVALLRSAQETLGDDADPAVRARLHYTLAQTMVRVEDLAGAHRESSAAMALVPADPPSEVRTWAAATHARMSYSVRAAGRGGRRGRGGTGGGRRARAGQRLVGHRRLAGARPGRTPTRRRSSSGWTRRCGGPAGPATSTWRCGSCSTARRSRSRPGASRSRSSWTRRATARARDLGMEWAFYPAELRHLQVTALYMVGDWDESLAEADLLARVPEMAAHVRAAGLLVLVGRGDPAAQERLEWARSLIPRLNAHVLLVDGHRRRGGRPRGLGGRRGHRRRGGRVGV